jgi:hypothetical protein
VTSEQCQHVIEKPDTSLDLRCSSSVKIQFELDLGFGSLPADRSCTTHLIDLRFSAPLLGLRERGLILVIIDVLDRGL